MEQIYLPNIDTIWKDLFSTSREHLLEGEDIEDADLPDLHPDWIPADENQENAPAQSPDFSEPVEVPSFGISEPIELPPPYFEPKPIMLPSSPSENVHDVPRDDIPVPFSFDPPSSPKRPVER